MKSRVSTYRSSGLEARRGRWPLVLIGIAVFALVGATGAWWAYENDPRVRGRVDEFYVPLYRAVNARSDALPTPLPAAAVSAAAPAVLPPTETLAPTRTLAASPTASASTSTAAFSPTPSPSPTPLPASVTLTGFRHEYQKFNNCGPASLAIDLSYWGWEGTQVDTAQFLKPNQDDKNVSPIEMYNYLTTIGFDAYIRVNGDLETLKRFIAAGYPVLVEKGFWCEPGEKRCNDWFGHYSVFVGYDDAKQIFIMQDTFRGPNLKMTYDDVLKNWRAFNFLYIIAFPADPERDAEVQALLGPALDLEQNYRQALQRGQAEIYQLSGEDQAFAWFNIGTNLHYLRDYAGAASAYDEARKVGLPYRMAWYQFGPYRAYYYMGRYQDVIDLATFAIESTPKPGLEEAFYWRGLAYEAIGQPEKAVEDYRAALSWNPNDAEAKEAFTRLGLAP